MAPLVNVNPFTPDTVRRNSEQQWRNSCRSGGDDDDYGRRYSSPPFYRARLTVRVVLIAKLLSECAEVELALASVHKHRPDLWRSICEGINVLSVFQVETQPNVI